MTPRPTAIPQDVAGSPESLARANDMVGRIISERYKVTELAAMGGMGAVYRGVHLLLQSHVAIKVLHPEIENFPELVARFRREAVVGAHIHHENVASASDFGKFDGDSYFLVLEWIGGATLSDHLEAGPVEPHRAVHIARQIAAGLSAAHEHGIVHRDLKPRNVMLLGGGGPRVKIIDFGLARAPAGRLPLAAQEEDVFKRGLTQAGVVFGTVGYLAPELAFGMSAVDERSDLYALGVILYEMLAGRHPFDETEPAKLFARHRHDPPPRLADRNPSLVVPAALEAVVLRLLDKDPARRFQSAKDAKDALDGLDADVDAKPRRADRGAEQAVMPRHAFEAPRASELADLRAIAGSGRSSKGRVALALLGVAFGLGVAAAMLGGRQAPEAEAAAPAPAPLAAAPAAPAGIAPTSAPRTSSEALALRLRLMRASEGGDPTDGARALLAMAEQDPGAFRDREVQAAAATVAARIAGDGGDLPDKVFFNLTYKLGSNGLDALYEVIAQGRSTKASARASAILSQVEVLSRATPALRVAFELRKMPCRYRSRLFARAGEDGDQRTSTQLEAMRSPKCDGSGGSCCQPTSPQIEAALARIAERAR